MREPDQRHREIRTLVAALFIGLTWESLLVAAGLVVYPTAPGPNSMAPVWMIALWANVACTIHYSLGWIRSRPWLSALLGAVGGPLAFVAGEKLGAVSFPYPVQALAVIAAGWAVLLPLLVSVSTPRRPSMA